MLDAYADDGSPLGAVSRAEVHERGLWHHVFHVLVVADRYGEPTAILQRRSPTKAAFPGLLDLSAAGHLAAGESPADGVREMHEELGTETDFDDLIPLGQFEICDDDPAAEGQNREIAFTYLARDDRPLADYHPDPIELSGLAEVSLDALIDLFEPHDGGDGLDGAEGAIERSATGREHSLDGETRETIIRRQDLVPDVGGYWPAILRAARSHC